MELRDQLQNIIETGDQTTDEKNTRRFYTMAAVAFVTILLGIGMILMHFGRVQKPDGLYAEYFKPYPGIFSQRSANHASEMETLKTEAFYAYENGLWREAHESFSDLVETSDDLVYVFYLGIVELKLDQPESALNHFEQVLKQNNPLFAEHAQWYAALANLKNGDISASITRLKYVVREKSVHSERAEELLKQLQ